MKCYLFLHLMGVLATLGDSVYPPGSCDSYTNISNPWRNAGYSSLYFSAFPNNDSSLVGQWWRFTGVGGDVLNTLCEFNKRGGSDLSIHLEALLIPLFEFSYEIYVLAYVAKDTCFSSVFTVSVVLCPGGFYIYRPLAHPEATAGYLTRHSVCQPDSCGPLAECYSAGLCKCIAGYYLPLDVPPPPDSYGCLDVDECLDISIYCGSYATCTNYDGGYNCTCVTGYEATVLTLPTKQSNPCQDIDECVDATICGDTAFCVNTNGSFECQCNTGYHAVQAEPLLCEDIDECLNLTLCGPYSICTNTIGLYNCACDVGARVTDAANEPSPTNICVDIDECVEQPTICGPKGDCTNTLASFICMCFSGYRVNPDVMGISDPCTDIDECSETPGLCGPLTVCFNKPGTYYCSCTNGYYPSTGITWTGDACCRSLQDILDELNPTKGQTKEKAFLAYMDQQLKDNKGLFLPEAIIANCFSACMEVPGVGPLVTSPKVSSSGDGETGSIILNIAERLIASLLQTDTKELTIKVTTSSFDLHLVTFGPGNDKPKSFSLIANGNIMEINLESLARNNNGSAAAAFLVLHGMGSLLSHQYFQSENRTEFFSDVFTAFLPTMNNTTLTEPVNFTLQHKEIPPESGVVTCVYWKVDINLLMKKLRGEDEEEPITMGWSVEGCWVSYSNENYTVCSCSHLSTFALILQTGEPPPQSDFLDWLNRICVIIGLFFFTLAILTFLLCSWNPKINNTARLHLCLNLGLTHLVLLFNDVYIEQQLACKATAGILHFLVVASFVWMLLEAVQLYMLVRRLNKVQVIERDGLPKPLLYIIGYGVPFVIVGVSALVYPPGYGATAAKVCWLSTARNFNWALTGPVITVLALNCVLFCATLWSLRTTLANMRSGASESKDTKLVLFKIVAQFVILGCTWILGLYQSNLFFQILFIVLNSQQGTFLYFVHCVLNKEIREECLKCLTCSHNKSKKEVDVVSVSEDLDKTK